MKPVPRAAVWLSLVVVAAAAAASLATLLWRGAFPDPSPAPLVNRVLAEARGWSAATLLLAIPLAAVSLRAARRGSIRGRLVWIGSLGYFVYTYLEFAVSPPFTALYLLYITAFACAIPALVMGVASIDVAELPTAFGAGAPRRKTAIFSLLFAALLALAWLKVIVSQTLVGSFGWPGGEEAVGHVVHALDLGLQVPLGLASGVLLLRRRPAGDLVAAMMLVNAVCMGAALTAMVAWASVASGTSAWSACPFATVWAVGIIFTVSFFRAGAGTHSRTPKLSVRPKQSDRPKVATPSTSTSAPRGRLASSAIVLEVFLAIGALGGGAALMLGPHGEIVPLPVSALAGSPFADYFLPGTILFAVLGLGPVAAAVIAWRRHPVAPFLALLVGGALLIWLAVEILIVGYSRHPPLQAGYLGLGVVITLVGACWVGQTAAGQRACTR